ncbi:hypothetical protein [Nitrosopumilus sp.]|uniref:hypothetical protein n=1 Tax=Nitrosopumilus sp. TaxID=2024843 RepID=UPI00349FE975
MDSVLNTQIPSTRSRLDGAVSTKEDIQNEILEILKKSPQTPSSLAKHFHMKREPFSRNYLYPLRDSGKIIKVDGSNYFQLPLQQNTSRSIKKALIKKSEIYQTDSFKKWDETNTTKSIHVKKTAFARLCLGLKTPTFKIHPDNITQENWKDVVRTMVIELFKVTKPDENGELNWGLRQAIRGFLEDVVEIKISKKEGETLKISGTKYKPKSSDLHITTEQVIEAKKLLLKRNVDPIWFLKFGVKTWSFVRPSTLYLIEIDKIQFLDQVVEYVEVGDGKKITDTKVIEYAKYKGDKIFAYPRRICHFEVIENKTDTDYHKYILDVEFVEPLEKLYNIRKSQRKKYLFWDDNSTVFTFENYDDIVKKEVTKDNHFLKQILFAVGFKHGDFGTHDRINYAFRHFGLQMWLIDTDYNYDLVGEMSHEDTATLKKWYGKRTQKDFQRKIKGVMMN